MLLATGNESLLYTAKEMVKHRAGNLIQKHIRRWVVKIRERNRKNWAQKTIRANWVAMKIRKSSYLATLDISKDMRILFHKFERKVFEVMLEDL